MKKQIMQGNEAIARAEILIEIAATCPEIYAEWAPEGKVTLAEKNNCRILHSCHV